MARRGRATQRRRSGRGWSALVGVVLLIAGLLLSGQRLPTDWPSVLRLVGSLLDQPAPSTVIGDGQGPVLVERVVDGDTLVLVGDVRVRLIGVDTPETKHPNKPVEPFGPEAAEFTRRAVEGRTVELRYDRDRYDRYQRLLAYVFVGDRCLNEELIRAGLSECVTQYPFDAAMKSRFQQAEAEARQARRGIWSRATNVASRPR